MDDPMEVETLDADADADAEEVADANAVSCLVPLTAGSATAISENRYQNGEYLSGSVESILNGDLSGPSYITGRESRIVMQVIGIVRLKYSTSPYSPVPSAQFPDSRDLFMDKTSICYSDHSRYWGNDTPYRFLLSDGNHTVPGKFFPEAMTPSQRSTSSLRREYDIHLKIHEMVKTGKLKLGSIISFIPNCHLFSGRGMVTMFQMEVMGWDRVRGDPMPCHGGALAYSPSNCHECTVPVPIQRIAEPIPDVAIWLAKIIQDKCGFCAVSGSAALSQYLSKLPGCSFCYETHYGSAVKNLCSLGDFSNDADIFVPMNFRGLANYYESGGSEKLNIYDLEEISPRFDYRYLEEEVLPELYNRFGIRHTDVVSTSMKLSGLDRLNEETTAPHDCTTVEEEVLAHDEVTNDYGWMRVFVGLKRKLQFDLLSADGEMLSPKPIEILVVDAYPKTSSQTWGDLIVGGFDVDIIKCIAHPNSEMNTGVESVTFSGNGLESLESGVFHYTMRPCHSFSQMMKRLEKYRSRGLALGSFSFDERVSGEWKDHILLQFHLRYARFWMCEWTGAAGISFEPDNKLDTVFRHHVLAFLENRSEIDLKKEARAMLRRNILAELTRNGGLDPGNEIIDRPRLLATWREMDKTDGLDMQEVFWKDISSELTGFQDEEDDESGSNNDDDDNIDYLLLPGAMIE